MSDLVVTVPRGIWPDWIDEGDPAGSEESGEEWDFVLGWQRPPIIAGERLYVVAHDRLRGYAPVTGVIFYADPCPEHLYVGAGCLRCRAEQGVPGRPRGVRGRWSIVRRGGAVAVTIGTRWSRPSDPDRPTDLAHIRGFRGFVKRWWPRADEVPFPDWQTRDLWIKKPREPKPAADQQDAVTQVDMFGGNHD